MSRTETINAKLKEAMLARQAQVVSTLRLLNSELKNAQINGGHELSDDEIIAVIRKEIKKRQDSATLYRDQNQVDRATAEEVEITILQQFLPPAVDQTVLMAFLKETAATLPQPLTPASKGILIKAAMTQFASQVDGKTVSTAVATLLGN